jgi:hypothetical protein
MAMGVGVGGMRVVGDTLRDMGGRETWVFVAWVCPPSAPRLKARVQRFRLRKWNTPSPLFAREQVYVCWGGGVLDV